MLKRICSFSLIFFIAISIIANPIVANASALPNPEPAQIIDFVEYCTKKGYSFSTTAEAKALAVNDAKSIYNAMGGTAKTAVSRTVGGGALTSLKTLGWVTAGTAITEYTVLSLGRALFDELEDLDDDLTQYICSVVFNCESDATYYATHVNLLESRFISSFDDLLSKKAGTEWAVNSGLVERTALDSALLGEFSDSTAEFIQSDLSSYIPLSFYSGTTPYIQFIPPCADTVYVSYDYKTTYICDGLRVLNGYVNNSDVGYIMGYNSTTGWGSPTRAFTYSVPWDLSKCNYGGLKTYHLLQGSPIPNTNGTATPNVEEITELYVMPMVQPETKSEVPASVAVPNEEIENVLNDETSIDDYVDKNTSSNVGTDTSGFWGKLWEFLQTIVDAILFVPQAIIDAFKDLFRWLFVPDSYYIDQWVSEQMTFMDSQTGVLTYPLVLVLDFFDRISNVNAGDMVLTIPNVKWMGSTIIKETSFNMTEFLNNNAELKHFMQYYYVLVKVILIMAVVNLARKKLREMEMN